jgi:hypothetical protein
VAARSKALVCGRSLAGIAGSNFAVGMDVCLVSVVRYASMDGPIPRQEELYRVRMRGRSKMTSQDFGVKLTPHAPLVIILHKSPTPFQNDVTHEPPPPHLSHKKNGL